MVITKGFPKSLLRNKSVPDLNNFCCVECKNILRNPYQNSCGHRYCRDCLERVSKETPNKQCILCVLEGCDEKESFISFEEGCPDNAIKRDMNILELGCPNEKCKWEGSYKSIDKHLDECQFKPITCPKCKKTVISYQFEKHQATKCGTIEDIQCPLGCNDLILDQNGLKLHMENNIALHFKTLNDKLKVLKIPDDILYRLDVYEKSLLVFNDDLESLTQKCLSLGEQLNESMNLISSKDHKIKELSDKVDLLEKCTYDGTLVWRLANFKDLMTKASTGTIKHLLSPYFYTSKTGYKLCARLYLKGDSMGKDTHISIYLVIMRGRFDALLEWPFRHQVVFEILDQSGSKNHVMDSFLPDPFNSSFSKPTTDMNKATGFPLFCSLHNFQANYDAYVKDDVAFIRISVNVNDHTPNGRI